MKDIVLEILLNEFPNSNINETPQYTSLQTKNGTGKFQNYIEIHFNENNTKLHIRSNELSSNDLKVFEKVPESFGWVLDAEASITSIEELRAVLPQISKSYFNVKNSRNPKEIQSIGELLIGDKISNTQLAQLFSVAPQGGMRKSNALNHLVLITDHTKELYKDRWDDNLLYYSGMGQNGDQKLKGNQNITLYESRTNGVTIYLFEVLRKHQYTFRGVVELVGTPFQETHDDSNGKPRLVWVFPLRVQNPILDYSENEKQLEKFSKKSRKKDNSIIEEKSRKLKDLIPSKRIVQTSSYERDTDIIEYAKRRAQGKCELCQNELDFFDLEGRPFLETHHIKWLSKGGDDSIENTVAICPNCHKKMHVKNDKSDVNFLLEIDKFIIE